MAEEQAIQFRCFFENNNSNQGGRSVKRKDGGRFGDFTLMELLVTIGIIIFLMSIMVSVYSLVMRAGAESKCKAFVKRLEIAMEMYREKHGYYYPASSSTSSKYLVISQSTAALGLDDLYKFLQPTSSEFELGTGTPIPTGSVALKDPWGEYYIYTNPGSTYNRTKFDFYSAGADLTIGPSNNEDNIGNFSN